MRVLVFPNRTQKREAIKYADILVIENDNDFSDDIIFDDSTLFLCCNEEAIYWCIKKGVISYTTFSSTYKSLIYKSNAEKFYAENNIPHLETSAPNQYPCIVKPDFGFGSIGVKIIHNQYEYDCFVGALQSNPNYSHLSDMLSKYFGKCDNRFISQKYYSYNTFFSVPFIWNSDTKTATIFPIVGNNADRFEDTDFRWTEFAYDEELINRELYERIRQVIEHIAIKILKNSQVGMAEVLYDIERDVMRIVEFSPRVPGGRLSELIKKGSGIDLDELSVRLFMKSDIRYNKLHTPVSLSIEMTNDNPSENVSYSRLFNKRIRYVYKEKNRRTTALVPGRFAPFHVGHQLLIEKALSEVEAVIVLIFETEDISIPVSVRANWIRNLYPQVTVIEAIGCPDGHKYAYEYGQECAYIQNKYIIDLLADHSVTHLYHSTTYGASLARALNVIDIMVDLDRNTHPVSGTMIRKDLKANRKYLDESVYNDCEKYLLGNI